ncbi:hypothetical protein GGX14DRAFT_413437 [Mycena pura]|uniref:Nucleolar protein n=1 Tax=Mycena pura TaxID=153505 RepID=A0AAD6YT12_9AGAR|nr:hypothetical protein GGX14DRAFT_413437 [Mycena pura]
MSADLHHDPALQPHKKKKRRPDETRDGDVGLADTATGKRKKRKESEVAATVEGDSVLLTRNEMKKRMKEQSKHPNSDQAHISGMAANVGTEEKRKKRKRDDTTVEASTAPNEAIDATPERKKKKKRKTNETVADKEGDLVSNEDTAGTTPSIATADAPRKKKKSKEKASASTDPPPSDTLFPLPSYATHLPFESGAPLSAVFPTLNNNLSFPDLSFDSNEDILRAFQNVDIAGVLKTLSDAADAANVPLTGMASSSTHVAPAPASSSVSKSAPDQKKKPRRAIDLTLPPSGPQTTPDHALLLTTKWLSPTQLAELVKNEGLVYKKGKFSAVEAKQINEAIETYRTSRGLSEEDVDRVIFPTDGKEKDTAFWTEIASAVSQRPIIAVYHYLRRMRHPLKQQGKWRPEEDVKLIQAVTSLGQQWEKVATHVGRMATDCRDRYRNYIVGRENRHNGAWTPDEEDKLTRLVTEMQRGKDLDHDVFWTKISLLMGETRSRQQCRIKWTDSLSKKFKSNGARLRWSTGDASTLISKIDALNVRDDTEVDWKSLPDSQWNLWSAHALQRRWLTMKKGVKGFEDMTHREIMDILRVKNAETPHSQPQLFKSASVIESSDEEPHAGSSTGLGTIMGEGRGDDSD